MARLKKTQPGAKSHQEYVLYPSRLRMGLIYSGFFAVAVLAGWLIRIGVNSGKATTAELFDGWYINLAIVIGGAILFAFLDFSRWTIRVIDNDRLEGPAGALGERLILSLREINWPRSSKSLNSRLKVGNAIYSVGGKRILISPWFYEVDKYADFLKQIGYPQSKG